jgi:Cof subfamily protein (haloacid dehalogenase superfamily)
MKGKRISDLYLFCDVDGTLMLTGRIIPEKNLEAIRRFVGKGGHFALATGRSLLPTRSLAERVGANAPCILYNGGAVYDYGRNKLIHVQALSRDGREAVRQVVGRFPHVRATVCCLEGNYEVGAPMPEGFYPSFTPVYTHMDEIRGEWLKAVFHVPEDEKDSIMDWIAGQRYPDISLTSSSSFFVELLPESCSKGRGLEELCRLEGICPEHAVAVGDYYNDLELLRRAAFSACVDGAPPEIEAAADLKLCRAEEGAVAMLIEYLEALCGA